jgi:hypothetical protein
VRGRELRGVRVGQRGSAVEKRDGFKGERGIGCVAGEKRRKALCTQALRNYSIIVVHPIK